MKNTLVKKKHLIVILVTIILAPLIYINADAQEDTSALGKEYDTMLIRWYNVGSGDCIYIHTPDGENILIDGGLPHNGRDVVRKLKKLGFDTFDYVISTHPDDDHVGGLMYFFNEFKVKNFYYPSDCPYDTWLSKRIMMLAKNERGCNLYCPVRGDTIDVGDGATIRFVQDNVDYKTVNEDSLAMYIDYGNLQVLITGDTSNGSQNTIEKYNVDVTDLPHHGASNAASYKFIKRFDPEYVISSADGFTWNHPSTRFFKLLKRYDPDIKVLRTDKDGDITLKATRKKWWFNKKGVKVSEYAK